MATDKKISELNVGNPAQSADELVINRSGVDFSVTAASLAALAPPPPVVNLLTNNRGWKAIPNSGSFGTANGLIPNSVSNASSLINATATHVNYNQYTTSTVGGNQATVAMSGTTGFAINPNRGQLWSTQTLKAVKWQIIQVDLATVRTWIGLSNIYNGNVGNLVSDTPSIPVIGFRYSTVAGDTTWKAVCTNGTTQTTVDTGITVDSNPHSFGISVTPTSIGFTIDDVLVATITTNIPANTVQFGDIISVDNVGTTNAVSFAVGGFSTAE